MFLNVDSEHQRQAKGSYSFFIPNPGQHTAVHLGIPCTFS